MLPQFPPWPTSIATWCGLWTQSELSTTQTSSRKLASLSDGFQRVSEQAAVKVVSHERITLALIHCCWVSWYCVDWAWMCCSSLYSLSASCSPAKYVQTWTKISSLQEHIIQPRGNVCRMFCYGHCTWLTVSTFLMYGCFVLAATANLVFWPGTNSNSCLYSGECLDPSIKVPTE